jgi:hypothetical protein
MKYESLELIVQSSEDGTIYDLSNIAKSVSTSKSLDSSAGKCSFSIDTNKNKIKIPMGSTVSLTIVEGGKKKGKFFGYVFVAEPNGDSVSITAYDQLRYLKNNESYVLTGTTMEKVIKSIGTDFKLRLGTIEGSNYVLPERVEDNKSLGDIIQRAIDFTLQGTGKHYIIRDEFGYLCCRDIATLVTNLVIGDVSLLKSYEYKESIDSDVYNSVKLYKDNEKTGKREVYITMDSDNMKRWGKLQLFQSVDENVTDAQAREKAEQLLSLYNRVNRTLKLHCKGCLDLEPGNGIYLELIDIPGTTFNQAALITKIDDTYENGIHNMDLEVMFE